MNVYTPIFVLGALAFGFAFGADAALAFKASRHVFSVLSWLSACALSLSRRNLALQWPMSHEGFELLQRPLSRDTLWPQPGPRHQWESAHQGTQGMCFLKRPL